MTSAPTTLARLLTDLEENAAGSLLSTAALPADPPVSGVSHDNRQVRPGDLFVARKGTRFDPHEVLPDVVRAGAVAVVGERPESAVGDLGVPYAQVADGQVALAQLAASFYGHPSERLHVFGVTGTDGKTTTSFLLHWLLQGKFRTGLATTVGNFLGEEALDLRDDRFTTPEATAVQGLLAELAAGGATHVVLESSSHGLAMHRLDAVRFELGVLTNLTSEHLDYHGTFAAYRDAKASLMRRAASSVLNAGDSEFDYFAAAARTFTTFGAGEGATVRLLRSVPVDGTGQSVTLDCAGTVVTAHLPLVGRYNAMNAAAAAGSALAAGVTPAEVADRLATFRGVPGRMQLVSERPRVIVDFAHTPNGLRNALAAARVPGSRLLLVIGAAGERDPAKRPRLGQIAASSADFTVFTEEDSRSESTTSILEELAAGATSAGGAEGTEFALEPDRATAIRRAVALARPGDVVLLAGKGHERTLDRATGSVSWDEVAEALAALRDRPG